VSRVCETADTRLNDGVAACERWLQNDLHRPAAAAQQLALYLGAAKAALGVLPSRRCIVFERFFDEVGDTHLVAIQLCAVRQAHQGVAPCTPPQRSPRQGHIRTTMQVTVRLQQLHPHQRANPSLYNPRHPERTLLYQTVAEHYETWLELASAGQFDGQGDHPTPRAYVRQAFRKYLQCGIFAHGFARARCDDCGHDYFVAYCCEGRGVCPSCNTRRMVETAAHLTDHVFPRLPVRQWVLSVPKQLRYFMQRDGTVLNMVLRIFLRVIAQSLAVHCPGATQMDKIALNIGAVAFIHRFGSSLTEHVHFHVCVVDGVFEEVPGEVDADDTVSPPGVIFGAPKLRFHPASGIDEMTGAQAQTDLRRRILRAFVGTGLIERIAALVPPPRTHRHRYYGVLAPNSPLRAAAVALALAAPAQAATMRTESTTTGEGAPGVVPRRAEPSQPSPSLCRPSAQRRTTCGRRRAPASTRFFRCCARCAVGKCGSLPSLPRAHRSGRFWSTSVRLASRHTYPRHADHRCGTTVVRRRMTGRKSSRTGIWRRSPHRTTRWTSASTGEWPNRRF